DPVNDPVSGPAGARVPPEGSAHRTRGHRAGNGSGRAPRRVPPPGPARCPVACAGRCLQGLAGGRAHDELVAEAVDAHRVAVPDLAGEDLLREPVPDRGLDEAAQRPGTVGRIVALVGQPGECLVGDAEGEPAVSTRMALRKSTVRHWPSVRRRSSSTWRRMSRPSGWAFSTSSSSTTLYGRRRTASVSWPPSS